MTITKAEDRKVKKQASWVAFRFIRTNLLLAGDRRVIPVNRELSERTLQLLEKFKQGEVLLQPPDAHVADARRLAVERTQHGVVVDGEPRQTLVTHCVTAVKQSRHLLALQLIPVIAHSTLHLKLML